MIGKNKRIQNLLQFRVLQNVCLKQIHQNNNSYNYRTVSTSFKHHPIDPNNNIFSQANHTESNQKSSETQKAEDINYQNQNSEALHDRNNPFQNLKNKIINSSFIKNMFQSDNQKKYTILENDSLDQSQIINDKSYQEIKDILQKQSLLNNELKQQYMDSNIIYEQINFDATHGLTQNNIKEENIENVKQQLYIDGIQQISNNTLKTLTKNQIPLTSELENNNEIAEMQTLEDDLSKMIISNNNEDDDFLFSLYGSQKINYHSQYKDMLEEPEEINKMNTQIKNNNLNKSQNNNNPTINNAIIHHHNHYNNNNNTQNQSNNNNNNVNNNDNLINSNTSKFYQNSQQEFSFSKSLSNNKVSHINQDEIEQIKLDILEVLKSNNIKLSEKLEYLKLALTEQTLTEQLSQQIQIFFQQNYNQIKRFDQNNRLDAIYIYSMCYHAFNQQEKTYFIQNLLKDIRTMNITSISECAKVIYLLNQNKIFDKTILVLFFHLLKAAVLTPKHHQNLSVDKKVEYFDLFSTHQKNIHVSKMDQQISNSLKIFFLNSGIIDILEDISKSTQGNNYHSLSFLQSLSQMRFEIKIVRDIQRKCINIKQIKQLNNSQFLILTQIIYQYNLHFQDVIKELFYIYLEKLPSVLDRDNNPDYIYQFISFYQHIGTENIEGIDDQIINELKITYNYHLQYILQNIYLPYPVLMSFLLVQASNNKFKDLEIVKSVISSIDKKRRRSGMKNDQICLPLAFSYFQLNDPDAWRFLISNFDSRKVKDPTRFSQFAQGFQYCIENVPELQDSLELKMAIIECKSKLIQFSESKQDINLNTPKVSFQKQNKINFFVTKLILEKIGFQIRLFEVIEGIFYNTITIKNPQYLNININEIQIEEITRNINYDFKNQPTLSLKNENQEEFDKNEDIVILLDKPRFFSKNDLIKHNLNYLNNLGYNTISIGEEIILDCNPLDYQSTYHFTSILVKKLQNYINSLNKSNSNSQDSL